MTDPNTIMLLVAGGRGLRAGGGLPKQYRKLAGRMVITRTLEAALAHDGVVQVQPVIHSDDEELFDKALACLPKDVTRRILRPVHGGASRSRSVHAGLRALEGHAPETVVLIHDAARPFLSAALLSRALEAGAKGAAIPVLPVTDTVKQLDAHGIITGTVDRSGLRTVQTPQVFPLAQIAEAHNLASAAGRDDFTDDASLFEWLGKPVRSFAGDPGNVKLTTEADFQMAELRLSAGARLTTRVATGYDVHAFGPGDHVTLCGVKVPHTMGVLAHSDGDVALHALCDAIFGVLGEGDIGQHFPPSDPQWRGASSDRFLAFACERLRARNGVIDHLDISIVCEKPKIGPHRDAMQQRVAQIAQVAPARVGLKATTSEKLGFTGRSEGLAALATVTVRLPDEG